MHRKFGLLSPGKMSSHSTVLPRCGFSPCVQCFRVSIPPAVRHTLLQQMDIRSLTCLVDKFGGVPYTQRGIRHKQVCTRVVSDSETEKLVFPAPPWDQNPGSLDLVICPLAAFPILDFSPSHCLVHSLQHIFGLNIFYSFYQKHSVRNRKIWISASIILIGDTPISKTHRWTFWRQT